MKLSFQRLMFISHKRHMKAKQTKTAHLIMFFLIRGIVMSALGPYKLNGIDNINNKNQTLLICFTLQ